MPLNTDTCVACLRPVSDHFAGRKRIRCEDIGLSVGVWIDGQRHEVKAHEVYAFCRRMARNHEAA